MTDNRYLWQPDPKGEDIPQTLFGLPIYWTELGKESKPISLIILGTLDEYMTRRPITREELHRLLAGKAVFIKDIEEEEGEGELSIGADELLPPLTKEQWSYLLERARVIKDIKKEGEMTDPHYENPYDLSEGRKGFKLAATDGGQLMKDLLMKANRLEIEAAAYKNQGESLQRKLDAARAALKKLEWQACYQDFRSFWRCPECFGRKDRGHKDDCELQAAL